MSNQEYTAKGGTEFCVYQDGDVCITEVDESGQRHSIVGRLGDVLEFARSVDGQAPSPCSRRTEVLAMMAATIWTQLDDGSERADRTAPETAVVLARRLLAAVEEAEGSKL